MKRTQWLKVALLSFFISIGFLHAAVQEGKFCEPKMICPKDGKCDQNSCAVKAQSPFVHNIKYALRHMNISKEDYADIQIAIKHFKTTCMQSRGDIPLASLQNGQFDKKIFLEQNFMHKRMQAQAELLETIYLVLSDAQKKEFVMLIGANQHYKKLHPQMMMNSCNTCNNCPKMKSTK